MRTTGLTQDHSIQKALQVHLRPIKSDDPRLDFYAMYKRDAERMDAKVHLSPCVCAFYLSLRGVDCALSPVYSSGLFSTVTPVSVIDVQSTLEPDSNGRLEAYLNPPRPQLIHGSRRRPCRSSGVECSLYRDRQGIGLPRRKPAEVAVEETDHAHKKPEADIRRSISGRTTGITPVDNLSWRCVDRRRRHF